MANVTPLRRFPSAGETSDTFAENLIAGVIDKARKAEKLGHTGIASLLVKVHTTSDLAEIAAIDKELLEWIARNRHDFWGDVANFVLLMVLGAGFALPLVGILDAIAHYRD